MNEQKFHEYRRKVRKTQTTVAKEAGIDKSTLNNYIRGRRKPPMHIAIAIAKAIEYDVDPEGLFKEGEQDDQGTETGNDLR